MKINISHKTLLDIINLHYKVFYPIKEFVGKKDFLSIIYNYRTINNTFFPMPIYLNIKEKEYRLIKKKKIVEAVYKSNKVCILKIKSYFKVNKRVIGRKIFKTNSKNHSGYNEFINEGDYFVNCSILKFNNKIMRKVNYSKPSDVKLLFLKRKIKNITGFHTRNAPHKAHEWIHSFGLKKCGSLLIHPLIGQFKKGEYKEDVVIKSNNKIVKEVYKNKNIFFALFNSYPRYAGPREALFHAIVRKNYGCTHFLVGRDHAGIGKYYNKYESQKVCLKFERKLGIKIIPFDEPFLCDYCKVVTNKKCSICNNVKKKLISGTFIRKKLLNNRKIPEFYMDKKISSILNKNSIILK